MATPYSHQYNFTWELRPAGDWMIELGYVGSRSHKLLTSWAENRARLVEGIEAKTSNTNQRRPDPRYASVFHILNGSRAFYDAAKVTVRAPNLAGLILNVSYWWSKAIDLGADYTNTAVSRDARLNLSPSEFDVHDRMRGPSNFDQPHALLINAAYQTAAQATRNRFIDAIVGGWQATGVALLKTGTPFTIDTGSDASGLGNLDGQGSDRPNLVDTSVLGAKIDHPDYAQRLLPSSAFSFPTLDQASGNLGRNTFRKDGIFNVNAGLTRRIAFQGDASLQLRVESLNFLNHAQFETPGLSLTEDNFGQITNTLNEGRSFQFTLTLAF